MAEAFRPSKAVETIDELLAKYEHQAQTYWDFMSQEEREEYAWLAGIIDGEGAIYIAKIKRKGNIQYELVLRVGMTDKSAIERTKEITNVGSTYTYQRKDKPRRREYIWAAYEREAASVLRRCLQFLVTKKPHALLGLQFVDERSYVTGKGVSKQACQGRTAKWDVFYLALRRLNDRKRGIRDENG